MIAFDGFAKPFDPGGEDQFKIRLACFELALVGMPDQLAEAWQVKLFAVTVVLVLPVLIELCVH